MFDAMEQYHFEREDFAMFLMKYLQVINMVNFLI